MAGFLDGHALSDELASDVLLAVTEACTNVVQHAYRGSSQAGGGEIEVSAGVLSARS